MKRKVYAILVAIVFMTWSNLALAEDQGIQCYENCPIVIDMPSSVPPASPIITPTETPETISEVDSDQAPDEQNLISSANSTTTSTTDENTTINVGIDTGYNTVENSSLIEGYATGDIAGQITAATVANTDVEDNSQIEIKTTNYDNEITADDFNNMETVFQIEGNSDTANNFFVLNSDQNIGLELNTGSNEFNRNTVIGDVQTGNINFATNTINLIDLNDPELLLNLKVYTILDDFYGNIVLDESMLNEKPSVTIMSDDQYSLSNSESNIDSDTNYEITTGENTFARNSLVNIIESGNASVGYFQNDLGGLFNKTNFYIINVLGEWDGQNELSSFDNVVINTLSNDQTAYFDATGQTTIDQDTTINVKANTGRNSFRENTYINSLKTGEVNLMQNVISLQKTLSSVSNRLNIRVINILGRWRGNLLKTQTTPVDPPETPAPNDPPADPVDPVFEPSQPTYSAQTTSAKPAQIAKKIALANPIDPVDPSTIQAGPQTPNPAYLFLLIPMVTALSLKRFIRKLDK